LDPAISVFDGVLKIEDDGWVEELGKEVVDGTWGVASGYLPAAFARF